jgi:PadR family transcriptional regulator AphA
MSGYEVGQNIRKSVGHIWSESYGQIYPNLKKLAADGLLSSKLEKQKGKPDRWIYSLTAKGRKRLVEWLIVPPQPEIPRNEMLFKLFFGKLVSPSILIGYIEQMATEHRALLETFTQYEQKDIRDLGDFPESQFWRMTARFGQLEMEAHLRWAEETLNILRKMEQKQNKAAAAREGAPHARR